MSRKKTKADEFAAMADVHKILVHFDSHARARILASVEGKISAEQPKKRVRNKAAPLQMVGTIDISKSEVVMLDSNGNVIQ